MMRGALLPLSWALAGFAGASTGFVVPASPFAASACRAQHGMCMAAAEPVVDGDVVVVCGATGGVGRLVTESLSSLGCYKVRAVTRNPERERAAGGLGELPGVEVVPGDVRDHSTLEGAVRDAAVVVSCAGTTAFPSGKWGGGNTPDQVDRLGVENLVAAAAAEGSHPGGGKLKRFLLLSSVGVERRDRFPFSVLNTFGVLDAKAKGEEAVRSTADARGFSYVILRPGRLVGEPFTNPDMAALLQADMGAMTRRVAMRSGDKQAGDIARGSVAEAFVQALRQSGAADKTFTLVNVAGPKPSQAEWDAAFNSLT